MSSIFLKKDNYNHLVDDVTILMDQDIIEEASCCENWLSDNAKWDSYSTARAIEEYCVNIMAEKILLNFSSISKEKLDEEINERLKFLLKNKFNKQELLPLFLTRANKCRSIIRCTEGDAIEFIRNLEFNENILKLKRMLDNKEERQVRYISDEKKKLLSSLVTLKRLVMTRDINSPEFSFIKKSIERIMYLFKSYDVDNVIEIDFGMPGINICEVDSYGIEDIKEIFSYIERTLEYECELRLDYTLNYFEYLNNIISYRRMKEIKPITESQTVMLDKLDILTERYFGDDAPEELTAEQLIEYFTLFNNQCLNEASSRIITKGTEKVTKGVGNTSAKSRGMSSSKSKIGQIKRGARIVDDRASGAVNAKLDDIINFTRDAKREKLITGKNTVRLGKGLKTIIGSVAAGGLAKAALGPVMGTAATIITLLGARALSKRTEEREKKRILLELETELKIVKEKIEDARGDNNKQQKYQLMRIQANLEKEITRIRHGLRYY